MNTAKTCNGGDAPIKNKGGDSPIKGGDDPIK